LSISLASPMDDSVAGAILGSKIFIDQVVRQDLLALSAATDQPASHVLVGNFPPCAIIDEIAHFFEISSEFIIHRRGANRLARLSAIHCVAYYCRAHYSQAKMASYFQLSAAGFISAKIRARRLEGKDANTLKQVEHAIRNQLAIIADD
jgi:hypothetical protein